VCLQQTTALHLLPLANNFEYIDPSLSPSKTGLFVEDPGPPCYIPLPDTQPSPIAKFAAENLFVSRKSAGKNMARQISPVKYARRRISYDFYLPLQL